jgi:hypothetical protein
MSMCQVLFSAQGPHGELEMHLMQEQKYEMVLRERRLNMLQVLALQDEIWEATRATINLGAPGGGSGANDDDSYLAIAAIVGTLAELAARVDERDLGALVIEADQAWKDALANIRC